VSSAKHGLNPPDGICCNADVERPVAVQDERSALVREVIDYDFTTEAGHGIERTFPRPFVLLDPGESAESERAERISDVTVRSATAPDHVELRKGSGGTIRVGDPHKTIRGTHRYVLEYRITSPQLIDHEGRPVIIDFGIALFTPTQAGEQDEVEDVGRPVGSLAFMAPEQAQRRDDLLSIRCDVFGVAATVVLNLVEPEAQGRVTRSHLHDPLGRAELPADAVQRDAAVVHDRAHVVGERGGALRGDYDVRGRDAEDAHQRDHDEQLHEGEARLTPRCPAHDGPQAQRLDRWVSAPYPRW
jgi:hypothetical protein